MNIDLDGFCFSFRVLNTLDSVGVGLCLLYLSLIHFCFCHWLAKLRKRADFVSLFC